VEGGFGVVAGSQCLGDEMWNDLRVGVAGKGDTRLLQFGLQLGVVLDDAVVDHRDPTVLVGVWMGIAVVRWAVGTPACVADSVTAGGFVGLDDLGECIEFTGFTEDTHRGAESDTCRIVAAVFEASQPRHQYVDGVFTAADAADDPTHQRTTSLPASI